MDWWYSIGMHDFTQWAFSENASQNNTIFFEITIFKCLKKCFAFKYIFILVVLFFVLYIKNESSIKSTLKAKSILWENHAILIVCTKVKNI